MKKAVRFVLHWIVFLGFDFIKIKNSFRGLPSYLRDLRKMKKMLAASNGDFKIKKLYPVLDEKYVHNKIAWNYFFQDLWVAQLVLKSNPAKHVDVGSRIDGFVAHVATYREVEVYDIRAVREDIPNVKFIQADVCSENFSFINYCDSISSLHVIEHLGLGRYGDTLDNEGYLKGLKNITKALKINGVFYFSVPIGEQRIEFNAHRVFSTEYLLKTLGKYYKLEAFGNVDDKSMFHPNISLDDKGFANSFDCNYGCGIFVLRKTNDWL
jgi:SAM-dependent methyltransferase